VRVTPGIYNRGIFITLNQRDNEEYQLAHPAASLGGLLRGSLYISVADTCTVTCAQTKLKCLLTYVEESWFGKAQNRVHGLIFRYDPADDKYTRVKDVPDKDILVKIEGCWQEQITYTIPNSPAVKDLKSLEPTADKQLLIDLQPLFPVPKSVPPTDTQLPNESRLFWQDVTSAINEKRYADATRIKQDLEQAQRDKAAKRKELNAEFQPRFFTAVTEPSGKPELTEYGKDALLGMDRKESRSSPSRALMYRRTHSLRGNSTWLGLDGHLGIVIHGTATAYKFRLWGFCHAGVWSAVRQGMQCACNTGP
jgi:oxysterol-binding protein-related protein 9/10/11